MEAASCLSLCALTSVASTSRTRPFPGGAAAQTLARASAIASGIWRSSSGLVAWSARHAVGTEATGPKSCSCSFKEARSERQSAPSAIATARWVSTTPGSVGSDEDSGAGISAGPSPSPALRTGRATLTASGSPRDHANWLWTDSCVFVAQGEVMAAPL